MTMIPKYFETTGMRASPTSITEKDQQLKKDILFDTIKRRFQGDFDNYAQVVEDRRQGLLPREGGGHEMIHCTLVPLSETSRLAAFYFDGAPQRIFRFRYYELLEPTLPDCNQEVAATASMEMKLYTFHPELEGMLRQQSLNPAAWPAIFQSFPESDDKLKYLPNCEVSWSFDLDEKEHAYALDIIDDIEGVHAVMVHGEALVDSQMIPGSKIRILDQLSLYEDTFYINDRGLDPDTGAFIYGNQKGVPFRLQRVCNFDASSYKRINVNSDLKWTLGPAFRDDSVYEKKMDVIGGPSAQMNRPKSNKE